MQLQIVLIVCSAVALSYGGYIPPITIPDCPNGWYIYGGHCYSFIHQDVAYAAADSACRVDDAYLVTIDDDLEDAFIQKTITTLTGTPVGLTNNYFFSAYCNRLLPGEDCAWINGHTKEALGYSHWHSYLTRPVGTCGILSGKYGWEWDYYNCADQAYYICERPALVRPIIGIGEIDVPIY